MTAITLYDLNDMRKFVLVASSLSFADVASVLGVSKPMVHRGVRRLEEALGVRLLVRSTRDIALTADGENLLNMIGPLFEEIDLAVVTLTRSAH
jgi:DNA-binding transcriptional LysR family regulator